MGSSGEAAAGRCEALGLSKGFRLATLRAVIGEMNIHQNHTRTGKNKPKKVREHNSEYSQPAPPPITFRFVDLFCGIGGFRIAFERAGCECVFSCDWDKHAPELMNWQRELLQ